jgi:hypothetical protein
VKPTHAWNWSGRTPPICFIITEATDPAKTPPAMNRRPLETVTPLGSHITRTAPTKVRTMPSPRFHRTRSPSNTIDSRAVIGRPSCWTIAELDGLAVLIPMKNKANAPPPIRNPTIRIRHRGLGIGKSHGAAKTATRV